MTYIFTYSYRYAVQFKVYRNVQKPGLAGEGPCEVGVKGLGLIPVPPGRGFASSLESDDCGSGCGCGGGGGGDSGCGGAVIFFLPDAAATLVDHPTGVF